MEERTDTVLVIDDDEALRRALKSNLTRFGYEVVVAEDGEQGLLQASSVRPAVILLDLRMPRMDGHTFLRRFAQHHPETAVVATSADGDIDDVIEVMRHGAVDYLKKPWNQSELLSAINRAAEIHAARTAPHVNAAPNSRDAPPRATVCPESASVCDDLARALERLKKGEITIPSVPSVIMELRSVMEDPGVSVQRIVALLERDQRLLTAVLRLAGRSSYASFGKSSDAISAIGRIGLREVHELVESTWVNDCFRARDPRYQEHIVGIWRFSLARAFAVRALAQLVHLDGSSAYLGALLADVGACFLLWLAAEKRTGAIPDPALVLPRLREHHVPIGTQLLAKWGHTNDIVLRMVRGHHSRAHTTPDRYGSLLVLATDVALQMGASRDVTADDAASSPELVERCARELGITDSVRGRIAERLVGECEAVLAAMG